MDKRHDGKTRPNNFSRINKRIQLLEEHVAKVHKELRSVVEILGNKADTNELFSLIDKNVGVKDVTKEETFGTLTKVGKWTITIQPEHSSLPEIYLKGNVVKVRAMP